MLVVDLITTSIPLVLVPKVIHKLAVAGLLSVPQIGLDISVGIIGDTLFVVVAGRWHQYVRRIGQSRKSVHAHDTVQLVLAVSVHLRLPSFGRFTSILAILP